MSLKNFDWGKLTPKQRLFVQHYVNSWNGSDAIRKAGYKVKNAHVMANENLRKPYIVEKKEQYMSALSDEVGLTAKKTLEKLNEVVSLNYCGDPKLLSCVLKAIELAGKHHGLFTDKTEATVNVKSHEAWLEEMK